MLKREIKYEDFNGDTVTDVFYFNLSKTEIIELELEYEGGLEAFITRIIKAENLRDLVKEFKKIILLAYGERSTDGKRFIKSEELREAFSQTAAFDSLFMELATNEDSAATFIKGIIPADLSREIKDTPPIPVPPKGPDVPNTPY